MTTTPAKDTMPRRAPRKAKANVRRFFISYRRSEPDSVTLANNLVENLRLAGHEVFIDVGMHVGTDWVKEITDAVAWCDYLVVLLSDGARNSEMVQAEIRLAYRRLKSAGKPEILPIRMNYFGPLEYELEIHLGRLQYAAWNSTADSPNVLDALLKRAADEKVTVVNVSPTAPPEPADARRPEPKVDPRTIVAPGGSVNPADSFYIERDEDTQIVAAAESRSGETIVIKAARQMGKSTLLMRYLSESSTRGKKICFIDLAEFDDADFNEYRLFLQGFAEKIARTLGVQPPAEGRITRSSHLTNFIADNVLPVMAEPIVFAFDELDRLLGKDYQSDFFTMLRNWHNQRAVPMSVPWQRVHLAMVISTEPYLLIDAEDRSPFNVAVPLELEGFSLAACRQLNETYKARLRTAETDELFELLFGHPFLTRLAFYRIVGPDRYDFNALIDTAADSDGPFGDHLRALLFKVMQQPDLATALKKLIQSNAQPNTDMYHRLHGAGLARREEGRVVPANLLYARFFKRVL